MPRSVLRSSLGKEGKSSHDGQNGPRLSAIRSQSKIEIICCCWPHIFRKNYYFKANISSGAKIVFRTFQHLSLLYLPWNAPKNFLSFMRFGSSYYPMTSCFLCCWFFFFPCLLVIFFKKIFLSSQLLAPLLKSSHHLGVISILLYHLSFVRYFILYSSHRSSFFLLLRVLIQLIRLSLIIFIQSPVDKARRAQPDFNVFFC